MSRAIAYLEELNINIELNEIKHTPKVTFTKIVKCHVQEAAFDYLIRKKNERTSEHAKGKYIQYDELKMSEYLCPSEINISIDERKWLFKCRVDDIDVKGNRRWKYNDVSCNSCAKGVPETQQHILECEYLLGRNEILSYIPEYSELYSGDLEGQVYVSRLLRENYNRRLVPM